MLYQAVFAHVLTPFTSHFMLVPTFSNFSVIFCQYFVQFGASIPFILMNRPVTTHTDPVMLEVSSLSQ